MSTTKSEEITILVNSGYGDNKSADGHSFVQRLNPPLRVPANTNPTISCTEIGIWHTSPNIKSGVNNVLKFTFSAVSGGATQEWQIGILYVGRMGHRTDDASSIRQVE